MGCLTGSGVMAAVFTALLIGLLSLLQGGVLFSPGPLNAQAGAAPIGGVLSHAGLEGQCSACHTAFWEKDRLADRCTACHTGLLSNNQDFHAVMLAQGQQLAQGWDPGCTTCHTDHRGPQAALTRLDLQDFPHKTTRFSLQAHLTRADGSPFQCFDCHGDQFGPPFDQAICIACHQQTDDSKSISFTREHTAAFGPDCLACHDGIDTYGQAFDHSRAAFPLLGQHAPLACAQCHAGARSIADMKAAPQTCFACHAKDDPHGGRFGQDCESCHTPDDWSQAKFDHSLAAFPLLGKHIVVTCDGCHANNVFKGTPQTCYACHAKDDRHNGQLGQDCAACHSPEDWSQAAFDHSTSAFPLLGKHATVACQDCHLNNTFQGTPQACYACHAQDDKHNGQFGQACEACHTPVDWAQASFDHSKSAFPLTGAHQSVDCAGCHVDNVFQGAPTQCAACHADPQYHQGLFGTDCAACHTTGAWAPAKFNGRHTFPPNHEGANSCRDCHPASLQTYTCTVCHNQGEMLSKHSEEGIREIGDCLRCHPTGREEEGGERGGD